MKSEVQNKINKLLDSAAHHSYFDEAATLETLFQQINNKNLEEFSGQFSACVLEKLCNHDDSLRAWLVIAFIAKIVSLLNRSELELIVQKNILLCVIESLKREVRLNSFARVSALSIILKYFESSLVLDQTCQLDHDIYDKIQNTLIELMRDPGDEKVQIEAINVASYLQNHANINCPIIATYIQLLYAERKQSSLVRIQVLRNIIINFSTLNFIRNKLIFDEDEQVVFYIVEDVILNRITTRFVDAELSRRVVDALWKFGMLELLREYIEACLERCETVIEFMKHYLNLSQDWFGLNYSPEIDFKLMTVIQMVYAKKSVSQSLCDESLRFSTAYLDINGAFILRSHLKLIDRKRFKTSGESVIVEFLAAIEKHKSDSVLLYQLIDCIDYLPPLRNEKNANLINQIINLVGESKENNNLYVFDLLVTKMCKKQSPLDFLNDLLKFNYANEFNRLKVYSAAICRIDLKKIATAKESAVVDWIECLAEKFFMNHLGSELVQARELALKSLSNISMLKFNFNFIKLFTEIAKENVDCLEVFSKAIEGLFDNFLVFSDSIDFSDEHCQQAFQLMESALYSDFDAVIYVVCHGFAKLLINNCQMPSEQKRLDLLQELVLKFHTHINVAINNCLLEFFERFVNKADKRQLMIEVCVPTVNLAYQREYKLVDLVKIVNFLSALCRSSLTLLQVILNEMTKLINDSDLFETWIAIVVKFNVVADKAVTIDSLNETLLKLQLIMKIYEMKASKLDQMSELKKLILNVKEMLFKNC